MRSKVRGVGRGARGCPEIRRLNIVSSGFKSTMLSPDSRQVALRSSMVADSTALLVYSSDITKTARVLLNRGEVGI